MKGTQLGNSCLKQFHLNCVIIAPHTPSPANFILLLQLPMKYFYNLTAAYTSVAPPMTGHLFYFAVLPLNWPWNSCVSSHPTPSCILKKSPYPSTTSCVKWFTLVFQLKTPTTVWLKIVLRNSLQQKTLFMLQNEVHLIPAATMSGIQAVCTELCLIAVSSQAFRCFWNKPKSRWA